MSYVRGVVRVVVPVLAAGLVAGAATGRFDQPVEQGLVLSTPDGQRPEPQVVLREPAPEGLTEAVAASDRPPAALANDLWWITPAWQAAEDYILNVKTAWRQENPHRMLDVRSDYINVDRGLRRTWQAPPCDCRRVTVWLYGGSTTWGIDQRDEHTIASELARVASEHGLTIDVQNRGLTGFNQWMESERFAWDLTVEPKPDLAIFYDGVNEIYMAGGDNEFRVPPEAPVDPALATMTRSRQAPPMPRTPDGARVIVTDPPVTGPVVRSRDLVKRYDRARQMSTASAIDAGVPVRYVWQPSRYSRPVVLSEPHHPTDQENNMRLVDQVTSDSLAPDVVNLSSAFDGVTEPIFTDDVHHSERGARVMAEAMFAAFRNEFATLAAGHPIARFRPGARR